MADFPGTVAPEAWERKDDTHPEPGVNLTFRDGWWRIYVGHSIWLKARSATALYAPFCVAQANGGDQ